jgi:hypothetical protein
MPYTFVYQIHLLYNTKCNRSKLMRSVLTNARSYTVYFLYHTISKTWLPILPLSRNNNRLTQNTADSRETHQNNQTWPPKTGYWHGIKRACEAYEWWDRTQGNYPRGHQNSSHCVLTLYWPAKHLFGHQCTVDAPLLYPLAIYEARLCMQAS